MTSDCLKFYSYVSSSFLSKCLIERRRGGHTRKRKLAPSGSAPRKVPTSLDLFTRLNFSRQLFLYLSPSHPKSRPLCSVTQIFSQPTRTRARSTHILVYIYHSRLHHRKTNKRRKKKRISSKPIRSHYSLAAALKPRASIISSPAYRIVFYFALFCSASLARLYLFISPLLLALSHSLERVFPIPPAKVRLRALFRFP